MHYSLSQNRFIKDENLLKPYSIFHFYRKASAEAAAWCREQGHDITDISVLWSLAMEQIPTTLISTANPVNMARYRNR